MTRAGGWFGELLLGLLCQDAPAPEPQAFLTTRGLPGVRSLWRCLHSPAGRRPLSAHRGHCGCTRASSLSPEHWSPHCALRLHGRPILLPFSRHHPRDPQQGQTMALTVSTITGASGVAGGGHLWPSQCQAMAPLIGPPAGQRVLCLQGGPGGWSEGHGGQTVRQSGDREGPFPAHPLGSPPSPAPRKSLSP